MTGHDPTDHALAVIAAIFDKPGAKPNDDRGAPATDDSGTDPAAAGEAASSETPGAEAAIPAEASDAQDSDTEASDVQLSDSGTRDTDPTDPEQPLTQADADRETPAAIAPAAADDFDLAAYTRYGPGPLDALRFRWSLGRGEGGYYVEETIGATSQPIRTGPLSREDAIASIDKRARDQQRRFEELRHDIVSGRSERGDDEDGDEFDAAR